MAIFEPTIHNNQTVWLSFFPSGVGRQGYFGEFLAESAKSSKKKESDHPSRFPKRSRATPENRRASRIPDLKRESARVRIWNRKASKPNQRAKKEEASGKTKSTKKFNHDGSKKSKGSKSKSHLRSDCGKASKKEWVQ
jgi:hypothetical protein